MAMIRKLTLSALAAAALLTAGLARAQEADVAIPDIPFSFDGPFGTYDQHQLQRGLQVYTEVCSACHGLDLVAIRTLGDEGGPHLPADQVKAYAAAFPVNDTASNPQFLDGSGNARKLIPSDHFPSNNSMGAPDLSVMAKARAAFHGPYKLGINQLIHGIGGPQYIVALLEGFTGETKDVAGNTVYGNKIFPGGWIRMPNTVLSDGQVTFADGAPNDKKHEAEDVAAFLMWAAEPHLDARKHAGFDAVFLLIILTSLLYLTNKRIWAGVKGKKTA